MAIMRVPGATVGPCGDSVTKLRPAARREARRTKAGRSAVGGDAQHLTDADTVAGEIVHRANGGDAHVVAGGDLAQRVAAGYHVLDLGLAAVADGLRHPGVRRRVGVEVVADAAEDGIGQPLLVIPVL